MIVRVMTAVFVMGILASGCASQQSSGISETEVDRMESAAVRAEEAAARAEVAAEKSEVIFNKTLQK